MPSPDWDQLERRLGTLPRRAVVAVAARAARRAAHRVADAVPVYGPEAWEWLNAVEASVRVADGFAAGRPVSWFTLHVAGELPRLTASAVAATARQAGAAPHAVIEAVEMACAAAAYAADAAKAPSARRAAEYAFRGVSNAEAAVPECGRLIEFDAKAATLLGLGADAAVDPSEAGPLGELWPTGVPDAAADMWRQFGGVRPGLPRVLEV